VFIASDFEPIRHYRLVMIEGGAGMFQASHTVSDWYLSYIAPKIGGGSQTLGTVTEDFEVLHAKITDNIILWMKKK